MKDFLNWIARIFTKKTPANVVATSEPPQENQIDHVVNPAYVEAKKYDGKKEDDPAFNKKMSAFWPLVGLKNYKTIIGASFAWCALFIVGMNSDVGQKYLASAGAKDQGRYGQMVDWKKNGIPKGAVVHLNHGNDCKSESNNHVTFADGDCTSEELSKPDATMPGFGGNQNNTVKRSVYSVKEICEVRWPSELPLPGKITKSLNCSNEKAIGDSTQ